MRHRLPLLAALLALVLAGCRGPKSDCEGTLESFASIIDGDHWDDFPDLIYPPQRTKFGDRAIQAWIADNYEGATSFKFKDMRASVAGDVCLAATLGKWRKKIRGKNPEVFDDVYGAYTLHLVNGRWYMEVPGASKVSAY